MLIPFVGYITCLLYLSWVVNFLGIKDYINNVCHNGYGYMATLYNIKIIRLPNISIWNKQLILHAIVSKHMYIMLSVMSLKQQMLVLIL